MTVECPDAIETLRKIAVLSETQLIAAREMDSARVSALAEERADALFELRCTTAQPLDLDEGDRAVVRGLLDRIRVLDARLLRVARIVLDAIHPWSPHGPAPTYGRAGRMGAAP